MSSIATDLGENYEYARTIANNQVELIKLKLIENMAEATSILFLSVLLFIAATLSFVALLIVSVLLLMPIIGPVLSILTVMATCLILIFLIYVFRKKLIYRPIGNSFLKAVSNRI